MIHILRIRHMSKLLNVAVIGTVATLFLWTGTTASQAGGLMMDLSVNITQEAGGLYEYDYALSVNQSRTLGGSQLFLAISTGADLSSVSAPNGWDIFYNPGDPDVSFLSSAPSSDIAPGGFGLFSVTSPAGPAASEFLVRGFDYNAGTSVDNVGTVLTPSAVPEPSGLVLGLLGVACVAVLCRTRRLASGR
jgi:hypothetical protein